MNKDNTKVVIVTGPTATGKTSLAVELARKFNGEIISVDSRQVYKGLDLGTGKDLDEYISGGTPIKHHLIDILRPEEIYSLKQFNIDSKREIFNISQKNKLPILAGGTVSYLDSLLSDYQFPLPAPDETIRKEICNKSTSEIAEYIKLNSPDLYKSIDNKTSRPRLVRYYEKIFIKQNNQKELSNKEKKQNYNWLILGTYFPRKKVHKNIKNRMFARIEAGMIEEVEKLHNDGVTWERLDSYGLEYRYISQYLKKEISYNEMCEKLLAKIRRLARSQDIWFRKLENNGHNIYWLEEQNLKQSETLIENFLNNKPLQPPKIRLKDIYYGPKSQ
jgi:tRNA dimethylallyltransferase